MYYKTFLYITYYFVLQDVTVSDKNQPTFQQVAIQQKVFISFCNYEIIFFYNNYYYCSKEVGGVGE